MHRDSLLVRMGRLLLLALPPAALGALALLLFWGQHLVATVASAGDGEVDISMAVKGGRGKGPPSPSPLSPPPGCTTKLSSTDQCGVPVNGVFTVSVYINSLSSLPDKDDPPNVGGYTTIQARLNYSTGLGIGKGRPNVTELGPGGDPFWPDCANRSESLAPKQDQTPSYVATCSVSGNESTYTGLVMEQDFACLEKGKETITLKHGNGNSLILDENGSAVSDPAGPESITVECQQPSEYFQEGFKCYRVTAANPAFAGQPRFQPVTVTLKDQFEVRQSRLLAHNAFCTPVDKQSGNNLHAAGVVGPIPFFDPSAHLSCYTIEFTRTEPAFRRRDIFVVDQFGSRRLNVVRPTRLCESTEKDETSSEFALRFKCYKARNAVPTFSSREVTLLDQFGDKPSTIVKPVSFCTLATKRLGEGIPPLVPRNAQIEHLVCYAVEQDTFEQEVLSNDQFDLRRLTLGRTDSFCTPALKTAALVD